MIKVEKVVAMIVFAATTSLFAVVFSAIYMLWATAHHPIEYALSAFVTTGVVSVFGCVMYNQFFNGRRGNRGSKKLRGR